jgi:hypothetical protein
MTYTGDWENGSGTSSAWSLCYLVFHTRRALTAAWTHRHPLPLLLTACVASNAGIQSWTYLGRPTKAEGAGGDGDDGSGR